MNPPLHFSAPPASEWHDIDYLRTASNRGVAIPLFMAIWIAVVDLLWPRTNPSILYVAPLMLMAMTGSVRPLWRSVGLFVGLTYVVFFLKNTIGPDAYQPDYLNYRLLNRTFAAATLMAIGFAHLSWLRWRQELADPELPERFRQQEIEITGTLAMICCLPLIVLIATIDFLAPANYNLAILYPIPLFICGWTQSRPLLWGMCALLIGLTSMATIFGPPADSADGVAALARNRVLAAVGMTVLSALLSTWMRRNESISP